MNENQIIKEIRFHKDEIQRFEQLRVVLKSRKWWTCKECGKKAPLGQLTLGIEGYYVEPEGCSGGDYTTTSKEPPYHIECPKCKEVIRHWSTKDPMWIKIHENLDGFGKKGHGSLCNAQGGRWHILGDPPLKFVFDKPRRGYLDVY